MTIEEAEALRIRWNGGKCSHPDVEKEYSCGASTGDYVCKTCGEAGWGRNWPEQEKKGATEMNVSNLTEKTFADLIRDLDDSHSNRIVVTNDGNIECIDDTNGFDKKKYKFWLEAFDPCNDYVGKNAANDASHVKRHVEMIRDNWNKKNHGLRDY